MEGNYVAYYRVSTQKQGRSGLGLEAQKEAVANFLNGGSWKLLAEFTETETGKGSKALTKRPVLKEAIDYAKKHKAKLLIAKLDRLARNVHFISSLMESKVKFVCADMPEVNELVIHVLAAVAEFEGKRISERTKEALAKSKKKLGTIENLQKGCKENVDRARQFAESLRSTLEGFIREGLTQREMVARLNETRTPTYAGSPWQLISLQRVLKRLDLSTNKARGG